MLRHDFDLRAAPLPEAAPCRERPSRAARERLHSTARLTVTVDRNASARIRAHLHPVLDPEVVVGHVPVRRSRAGDSFAAAHIAGRAAAVIVASLVSADRRTADHADAGRHVATGAAANLADR